MVCGSGGASTSCFIYVQHPLPLSLYLPVSMRSTINSKVCTQSISITERIYIFDTESRMWKGMVLKINETWCGMEVQGNYKVWNKPSRNQHNCYISGVYKQMSYCTLCTNIHMKKYIYILYIFYESKNIIQHKNMFFYIFNIEY